ncbi:hypothetical protein Ais01nite_16080 [Asanoa ishikariensis]|uniref:Ricin-type beta-trefoil lectin domain-containing protein n=1 Tax=Asanoa ishikariensis TaxID=137265 RepID=A0A1H3UGV9_9ACTN|nr:RICIN domain-containing protein [Asanoa ishikariensis]GIF63573.1 hypothetical protein Ais01nite_16080 [Asanoa ishikariensis]SDZ61527.1 Ricin-type beta-trefoil lectin domain-containing protein [Asanoa ishikariensis]
MIRRILGTLLAATLVAAGLTAFAATPAAAAAVCNDNDPLRGPYWWAGVDAVADSGTRKVLAVSDPWAQNSTTYIWDYNNDNRQKWYMDCTSDGVYFMRLASNTALCLTDRGAGFAAVIWPCGWSDPGMYWEQHGAGQAYTVYDGFASSYRFVSFHSRRCLDVFNGDSGNGTMVTTWNCNGLNNQRWY